MKAKLVRFFRRFIAPCSPKQRAGFTKPQRIAFITKGSFSHANARILRALQDEFPQFDVEHIDLADILRKHRLLCFLNLFHTLKDFAGDLLRRKRSFRECFYLTAFLFEGIKSAMPGYILPGVHLFSLQTQSLLDCSVPGIPHFVYTDHSHLTNLNYPAFDRRNLLPEWWIKLETSIYRNARKVFVMTRQVERTLLEHYGCEPARVSCIHAGSNVAAPPAHPEGIREPRVLFVGVNWKRKGGPQLLEAFLSVLPRFPKAKLVIVGCSPKVDHPNVEILGRVPLEQVQKEYQKAQLFAFPTRIEPTGFVAIEALQQKLPLIGSPFGIMPEVVRPGETGHLIDPEDIQGIAAALADLLADPEKCRRFGELGFQIVQAEFTWEAVGASLRREILEALQA